MSRLRPMLRIVLWMASVAVLAVGADLGPLDAFVAAQMKSADVPGAAVAVVQDGRVVYSKAFGVADVETQAPMTTEHLFRIGSTTKMITAAAVLSLVEEGKLDLKAPVSRYVKGLDAKIGGVTVHQLLSHTAGLSDFAPMYGRHDDTELGSTVRGWTASTAMHLPPGQVISYSNPGYWLAGLVLEEVSGKPFADAVAERVLKPAGMTRSTFRPTEAMTYPLAQQHDRRPGAGVSVVRPFADNSASWPAGSLFSSASDLARWMIAFMGGVLPAKTVELMSTGQAEIPGSVATYSYGITLSRARGLLTLAHAGSRVGYGSTIAMAPERRAGVVVLTNRSGASLGAVAERALEMLLELTPGPVPPKPEPLELTSEELRRYAGTYAHGSSRVRLGVVDGKLVVVGTDGSKAVQRYGPRQMFAAGIGPFAGVAGPDGRIAYLHSGMRTMVRTGN